MVKKKSKETPLIGLISSKNPVQALEVTVRSLFKGGCNKVYVVDDGSDDPASAAIFKHVEKLGAKVIHLKKNVGKAKALRAGFQRLPKKCIIVQTDDDTLAGNLTGPAQWIRDNKADIVDIRIETVRTNSLLGIIQELDYWMVNAVCKRIQNWLKARLWLSGAAAMYTYEAGKALILEKSRSLTEDTEGLYRARAQGFRIRFYSKHDGQFLTLVPEDMRSLHKQWKRWATGNGQLLGVYGLGGGNVRVAAVNAFGWIYMVLPIPLSIRYGLLSSLLWSFVNGLMYGVLGAIRLKRPILLVAGLFLPFVALFWMYTAFEGLFMAYRLTKAGTTEMTWVSPKRVRALEMTS